MQTETPILFQVECQALGRNVILRRQTWDEHILPPHPYMRQKFQLLKRAIKETVNPTDIKRHPGHGPRKRYFDFKCPDFEPMHRYLRVALVIVNDDIAYVATAFKVN